jgi:hypothetical protein
MSLLAWFLRTIVILLVLQLVYRWFVHPFIARSATERGRPGPKPEKTKLKRRLDLNGLNVEDGAFKEINSAAPNAGKKDIHAK